MTSLPQGSTPETDAQLAACIHYREKEHLSWPDIGRKLGAAPASMQQKYDRYMARIGRTPERFRVNPSGSIFHYGQRPEHAEPVRAADPIPALGTPQARTVNEAGVAQRVLVQAERRPGWQQSILVSADHHFDSVHCTRELLAHHMRQAVDTGAGIVVLGDIFCAMQGRMDKRGGKADLRDEYKVDNYADALVDSAAQWYEPYASSIWMASYGNHESKYQQIHETDILRRWVTELNRHAGGSVLLGAFAGFLTVECAFPDGPSQQVRCRYHHGWGGGGPVTLGTIGTNRMAASADYDAYWQGHIHEKWAVYRTRETIAPNGDHVVRDVPHLCCGPYKGEGIRGMGWHIETGKPQKPLGGWWMDLYWSDRAQAVLLRVRDVDL